MVWKYMEILEIYVYIYIYGNKMHCKYARKRKPNKSTLPQEMSKWQGETKSCHAFHPYLYQCIANQEGIWLLQTTVEPGTWEIARDLKHLTPKTPTDIYGSYIDILYAISCFGGELHLILSQKLSGRTGFQSCIQ